MWENILVGITFNPKEMSIAKNKKYVLWKEVLVMKERV